MSRARFMVTPVDRVRAGSWIISGVGPLVMPSVDELRASLLQVAHVGPQTRVGLVPSDSSLRWEYAPERLADCVEVLPDVTHDTLADAMSQLAREYRGEGFRLFAAGDYLLMAASHGLCDGRLLPLMQTGVTTGGIPEWAAKAVDNASLVGTALKWYGSEPRRVRALSRVPRGSEPHTLKWYAAEDLAPMEPTLRWATIGPEVRAGMRAWMAEYAPKATEATLVFAAIAKALTRVEIPFSKKVLVLADARRYGRAARSYLGNFSAGLEFDFEEPFDAERLSLLVQDALRAGRPLATLGMISLKSALPPHGQRDMIGVADLPVVSFSDIGRAVDEKALPWRNDTERAYLANTEVVAYNGLSFLVVEIGGGIAIQCSFNAAAHDPARIEAMLASLCANPLDLFVRSA